jgi:glycosyltransferase involved in cell wall biosynthesis
MTPLTPANVSAVVCTLNSISGIEACLHSLKDSGVGQIIVVDANSTDGTAEIAAQLADLILQDTGAGLGNARNLGIAQSTGDLILNMGSDNALPPGELQKMINYLANGGYHGVSAQTKIAGEGYIAEGLNVWRAGRFPEGVRPVIGTPTLFTGELLRTDPYDPARKFSDDSDLCERWARNHNSIFAISDAQCLEIGKTSWTEVKIRAQMYGVSDFEVYSQGSNSGWGNQRKFKSLTHPLFSDLVTPLRESTPLQALTSLPFLTAFTSYRYWGWLKQAKRSG